LSPVLPISEVDPRAEDWGAYSWSESAAASLEEEALNMSIYATTSGSSFQEDERQQYGSVLSPGLRGALATTADRCYGGVDIGIKRELVPAGNIGLGESSGYAVDERGNKFTVLQNVNEQWSTPGAGAQLNTPGAGAQFNAEYCRSPPPRMYPRENPYMTSEVPPQLILAPPRMHSSLPEYSSPESPYSRNYPVAPEVHMSPPRGNDCYDNYRDVVHEEHYGKQSSSGDDLSCAPQGCSDESTQCEDEGYELDTKTTALISTPSFPPPALMLLSSLKSSVLRQMLLKDEATGSSSAGTRSGTCDEPPKRFARSDLSSSRPTAEGVSGSLDRPEVGSYQDRQGSVMADPENGNGDDPDEDYILHARMSEGT